MFPSICRQVKPSSDQEPEDGPDRWQRNDKVAGSDDSHKIFLGGHNGQTIETRYVRPNQGDAEEERQPCPKFAPRATALTIGSNQCKANGNAQQHEGRDDKVPSKHFHPAKEYRDNRYDTE